MLVGDPLWLRVYWELQYRRLQRMSQKFGLQLSMSLILAVCGAIGILRYIQLHFGKASWIIVTVTLLGNWRIARPSRKIWMMPHYTALQLQIISLVEHALVGFLPVLILIVWANYFATAVLLTIIALLITYGRPVGRLSAMPTPFKRKPFECPAGFRKYGWLLLIVYCITWQGTSAGNVTLVRFAVVGLGLLVSSFYADPPAVELVRIFNRSSKHYLLEKMQTASYAYLLFIVPPMFALICIWPSLIVGHIVAASVGGVVA